MDCTDLEDIYLKFNTDPPAAYKSVDGVATFVKARALSVSDVVGISSEPGVKPRYWYCDNFGWKEVEFDPRVAGR